MPHLKFPDHRGSVVGDEEFVEVVDDHLVHAVWPKGGLDHVGHVLREKKKSNRAGGQIADGCEQVYV